MRRASSETLPTGANSAVVSTASDDGRARVGVVEALDAVGESRAQSAPVDAKKAPPDPHFRGDGRADRPLGHEPSQDRRLHVFGAARKGKVDLEPSGPFALDCPLLSSLRGLG